MKAGICGITAKNRRIHDHTENFMPARAGADILFNGIRGFPVFQSINYIYIDSQDRRWERINIEGLAIEVVGHPNVAAQPFREFVRSEFAVRQWQSKRVRQQKNCGFIATFALRTCPCVFCLWLRSWCEVGTLEIWEYVACWLAGKQTKYLLPCIVDKRWSFWLGAIRFRSGEWSRYGRGALHTLPSHYFILYYSRRWARDVFV